MQWVNKYAHDEDASDTVSEIKSCIESIAYEHLRRQSRQAKLIHQHREHARGPTGHRSEPYLCRSTVYDEIRTYFSDDDNLGKAILDIVELLTPKERLEDGKT